MRRYRPVKPASLAGEHLLPGEKVSATGSQPVSRRSLLQRAGSVAATGALSAWSSSCEFLFPGDDKDDAALKAAPPERTPCRFCGVGCGLLVFVSQGKVVGVRGDPDSPVNRGLLCAKGYHSTKMLYGRDRLRRALIRKNGYLVEAPLSEAYDLIAAKMKQTMVNHGPASVAIYGSGQWTIPEGYTASKFMRAGIGSNSIEANARLCMASAVTGFMSTFGADEPPGCYEDFDHANTFVFWGNNPAEMHPVLFSRASARRLEDSNVVLVALSTRFTRTNYAANSSIIFKPNSDLAIANAICHEIIRTGKADWNFVEKHCRFQSGRTGIGYGLEDSFTFSEEARPSSKEQYIRFLEDYTPDKAEEISGVPAADIRWLAGLYGDPTRKVMSLWCMGFNQHTRGTWINNLVYNIHLLTGKISSPGNSPFSLTGQPSACGTSREVGTFTHRLPTGLVTDRAAREKAAAIWKVPVERIPDKPTYHTVEMFRALDRGDVRFLWVQVSNPMVTLPGLDRYRQAAGNQDRFIVVSDVYPTRTTEMADVVLPSAMWIEKEGLFGNSERRTQYFAKMVEPPGDATSDSWQIIEVARRMGYGNLFPGTEDGHAAALYEEYRRFHDHPAHRMAPLRELKKKAGIMWPWVDGKETKWRYNSKYDPAAKGDGFDFYGNADHRAVIWQRPWEPPPELPDEAYPFWLCTGRILEHWHTGSMTRRIPELTEAVPTAYAEMHPEDAAGSGIRNGDRIRLSSRRGSIVLRASIGGRGVPTRGTVFVPFFDETILINLLTLDALCPISKQPDYKKCAVRVERA